VVVLVPGHAGLLEPYAEQFPDLRLAIDHCGAPQQRRVPAEALDPVLRLARYRNVILKWSHAPFFFAATPYPFPDAVALLQRALAAFGPERIMWGSDFTVTAEFASWAEELFYIRDAAWQEIHRAGRASPGQNPSSHLDHRGSLRNRRFPACYVLH
jgi:predicted TIM-barrel fold metal-dependent hydrolase